MEQSKQPLILITEPVGYSAEALSLYERVGNLRLWDYPLPVSEDWLSEAQVLVVRLGTNWTEDLLKKAAALTCVVTPTTGLDHIDLEYASRKKIEIISLKGETAFLNNIPSTAEHTWTLLLAVFKKLIPAAVHVTRGHWNRNLFIGNNLSGKTLGILGLGRVGSQVARFGLAFGMKVQAYDTDPGRYAEGVEMRGSAAELFSSSDVVSIHIPAAGNDHFVDAALLQRLPSHAVLINTSRGSVWDEGFVADMVRDNRLAAVGTDVLQNELNESLWMENPLWKLSGTHPQVLITPHIAGATRESMAATEIFAAQKFESWWNSR